MSEDSAVSELVLILLSEVVPEMSDKGLVIVVGWVELSPLVGWVVVMLEELLDEVLSSDKPDSLK